MNTLLFCGDPHGAYEDIVRETLARNPVAVILLGDLEPSRPLHLELEAIRDKVYFIHGNHDTDSEDGFEKVFDSELGERNLHGKVVTLPDGTRIAGLGGVFRKQVWMPPAPPAYRSPSEHAHFTPRLDRWRSGPALRHWSSIYAETVEKLASQSADILVTHEAPSCHPHGFTAIDDLARSMGVRKSFHGHHHDRLDYSRRWPRLGFQAYGVGLHGISNEHGVALVLGEFDLARRHRVRLLEEDDES
jgi:hypothetical protein